MKNPNCFEESTTHGTGICIAVDIKWDTEGKNVELPYFVEIPDDVDDDIDAISDYLHDITGFCLFGFKLTYKTFIRIDSNVPHTVRGYFRDGAYVDIKPCSSKHHIDESENPTWVQAFWYDSNGNEIGRSAVKDTFFSDWTMNTSIDPELGEPITYTAQVFDI